MTDYELASLFYALIGEVETAIVNYTTVLFAFLVFAYFAADRLKPYMAVGISGFFLPIRMLVMIGGYVGALLFFFHRRKARQ